MSESPSKYFSPLFMSLLNDSKKTQILWIYINDNDIILNQGEVTAKEI